MSPENMTQKTVERVLSTSLQDFPTLRRDGRVYVDKTARIYQMIKPTGNTYFLARPRRFGKSLLCSTLAAIFSGERDLFAEIAGRPALAINSRSWDWKKHPVIQLDLYAGNYSDGVPQLRNILYERLHREARKYKLEIDRSQLPSINLMRLISDSVDKCGEQAVVIIDEYDMPLIDTLDKPTVHAELLEELKDFYAPLKTYDKELRFVFLTGVSKFAKVAIFSGFNQPYDISFDLQYSDICGFTEAEILANFGPEIDIAAKYNGETREGYLSHLKNFYDGYQFTEDPVSVYNPFSVLNHFQRGGKFKGFWYSTGTPTFLTKLIRDQKIDIQNIQNKRVSEDDLEKFDINRIKAVPLLWQTGYLTVKSYNKQDKAYFLRFPNEEVDAAFHGSLLDHYLEKTDQDVSSFRTQLMAGNVAEVMKFLETCIATLPADIIGQSEGYYHSAVHLIFTATQTHCHSEFTTSKGRIDTLVTTADFIYVFEFKFNRTAKEAMDQIDRNDYARQWEHDPRKLFKIGVNFSEVERNIEEWVVRCNGEVVDQKLKDQTKPAKQRNKAAQTIPSSQQSDNHCLNSEKAEKADVQQLLSEGREEWRQEGREEGVRSMLLKFLGQRFDMLPDLAQDMVRNAPLKKLEEWSEKFGKSTKLIEIFLDIPSVEQAMSGEREEILRSVLLMLLKQRFVTLPDMAQDLVSNAPFQKLGEWTEKVLKAKDLFEIFL